MATDREEMPSPRLIYGVTILDDSTTARTGCLRVVQSKVIQMLEIESKMLIKNLSLP